MSVLYIYVILLLTGGGYYICPTYSGYYSDKETYLSRYGAEQLEYLHKNFTLIGRETPELFRSNLTKILDAIGRDVHVILINGVDIDVSDWIGEDRIQRNREMNAVVDSVVSMYPNVDLLDMRKIVTSRKALICRDNRHFDRASYFAMAKELAVLCRGEVSTGSFLAVEVKRFCGKMKKFPGRVIRKVRKILSGS